MEQKHRAESAWWMLGIIAVFAIALLIWMLPNPKGFLGLFGSFETVPAVGWISATALTVAYIGYTLWALPVVRRMAVEISWLKLVAVPLAVLSGIIEELFFRQFLMDFFETQGHGLIMQTVVSAVLFAVVHVVWVFFARDWRILIPVFTSTFVLGVLFSGVYVLSDRVVLPVVLAHIAINLVIEPGLLHNAVLESKKQRQ